MTNNAVLLDKGIKCLTDGLGLFEAEQFIYVLLSQPFNYTEWRKDHLFSGMTVEEIREPLINLTLISGSLLFFSFSCGKLRKTIIKQH